ncbi:hypothetical protein EUTSA_v10009603mg, partial [Eutrema salsugineum]
MKRGESLEPIPTDLIIEIFSRSPTKSVARFRSLSKQWSSILSRSHFTELFLTRSWTRPRLLFAVQRSNVWLFYLSPQPQNPYDHKSSSLILAADFHIKFHRYNMWMDTSSISRSSCSYASGLVCFSGMWISLEDDCPVPVICNPNTGQYATLPKIRTYGSTSYSFLGFDPVYKQFKVMSIAYRPRHERVDHRILTLGGNMRWRKINCRLYHVPLYQDICINGVVCFDVRSEIFKFIDAAEFYRDWYIEFINYKGKLGVISWKFGKPGTTELRLWVLEDVEKHEWSKYVYILPKNAPIDSKNVNVAGVTTTGEIVLWIRYASKRFYVFYFNPERSIYQSVEIQGFGESYEKSNGHIVCVFVDHVEDLNVSDGKLF